MTEEWRDVIGYEGYYQVSNIGRIRRVKQYRNTFFGRIIKPSLKKKGRAYYKYVTLSKDNIVKTLAIHRMEAIAFLGIPIESKNVTRHLDGNSLNNIISNLEWGTMSENTKDSIRHGTFVDNTGSKHGMSRLTESMISVIRRMSKTMIRRVIADYFGVGVSTIDDVVNGRTWKHVKEEDNK